MPSPYHHLHVGGTDKKEKMVKWQKLKIHGLFTQIDQGSPGQFP